MNGLGTSPSPFSRGHSKPHTHYRGARSPFCRGVRGSSCGLFGQPVGLDFQQVTMLWASGLLPGWHWPTGPLQLSQIFSDTPKGVPGPQPLPIPQQTAEALPAFRKTPSADAAPSKDPHSLSQGHGLGTSPRSRRPQRPWQHQDIPETVGWTTAWQERRQPWWELSSQPRSEAEVVSTDPTRPTPPRCFPGSRSPTWSLGRTTGRQRIVGRRGFPGLPYRGLAGRNAVETFAWYSRPLQHSPGILR